MGTKLAWEDGEKPSVESSRGRGMAEKGEDEDIYLAASTVLKTTVVHFAELPRGTASSGGGCCDAGNRGTHAVRKRARGERRRKKPGAGREGNEMGAGGL